MELNIDLTFIISLAVFIGGAFVGLAALRRSGSEASKSSADAVASIMGASADVVKQLREQVADLNARLTEEEMHTRRSDYRINHLEDVVESWETWADRVLAILDRSLAMLGPEQAVKLTPEVKKIKSTKPVGRRSQREELAREEEDDGRIER